MKKLFIYTALLAFGLSFSSCDYFQHKEKYIFKYKTQVDADNLDCGYKRKEFASDLIKKWLRGKVKKMDTQKQKQIGSEINEKYFLPKIVIDHPKAELVQEIVNKMYPYLKNQSYKYKTFVLDEEAPNALTIPGGYIYITTGLLKALKTEDEIAYVLGHEMGHNENNHTKENARFFVYAKRKIDEAEQEEQGFKKVFKLVGSAITIGSVKFLSSYFDQPDELEADLCGIYLCYKAGYDPEKALDAFRYLKTIDIPKPQNKWKEFFIDLLRSHPWSEDRLSCATNYIQDARQKAIDKYGE